MSGAALARAAPEVDARRLYAELQAVKDQIAPGVSDAELSVYAKVCQHLALDPFAGEICLVGRYEAKLGRRVYRQQVTVAGRRVVAERTGRLRGIVGEWCGPRVHDRGCRCAGTGWLNVPGGTDLVRCPEPGELWWRPVWDEDEPPYCARTLVTVAGWDVPVNGTAKWDEFAQYTDKDRTQLSPFWAQMPSHMLLKVSESLALRRAFPEVAHAVASYGGWATDVDADDAAMLAEAQAPDAATQRPAPPGPPPANSPANHPLAAGGARSSRRGSGPRERVPDEVYDAMPEAQGYAPDDPGRPY